MRVKSVRNKLETVNEGQKMKIILSNNQTHKVSVKRKRYIDTSGREVNDIDLENEDIDKIIFSIERIPTAFKYVDELPNIHFGDLNPALISDYSENKITFQFSDTTFDVKNIVFEDIN